MLTSWRGREGVKESRLRASKSREVRLSFAAFQLFALDLVQLFFARLISSNSVLRWTPLSSKPTLSLWTSSSTRTRLPWQLVSALSLRLNPWEGLGLSKSLERVCTLSPLAALATLESSLQR